MSAAMERLIAAVEAGEWDGSWAGVARAGRGISPIKFSAAYHGSLDAAKSLQEVLLPEWGWKLETHGQLNFAWVGAPDEMLFRQQQSCFGSPARAWLLAILRAKAGTP